MDKKQMSLVFGGDMSVGENSAFYFEGINEMLKKADVRMAQLEEPFVSEATDFAGENRTTRVLEPLAGRFDLLTLSGNHFFDFGDRGVRDTLDWCEKKGIACCGGGMDIAEAKKPGFVTKNGVRFGVLAYNAQGPKTSFADTDKAGTAYVNFTRAYIPVSQLDQRRTRVENDVWELKKPVHINEDCMAFNFIDPESYDELAADVARAREQCDVLIVYFHKGMVHRPVQLDKYERFLTHVAVDNGADAVVATHSHIAHGVELYKGRAIYHGLNNLVMWVPHLSPKFKGRVFDTKDSHNEEWIKSRVERFGFVPDPEYPTYPFHSDSVYCMAAKFIIEDGRIASNRIVPMKVEKNGVPYVHGNTETGREICGYFSRITGEAGLNARYKWDGDDIIVY